MTAYSKKTINHAQEFFNRVSVLDSKVEVSRACYDLLNELAKEQKTNTISNNLSLYRKHFMKFVHENPELNEPATKNNDGKMQHCAVSMLKLTDEQKAELDSGKIKNSLAREGWGEDGSMQEINAPKIDISEIIEKSCECLLSNNPYIIASGIINLTGLRPNEQNLARYEHEDFGIIERQMVVVDEFAIGFKGLSKKKDIDDKTAFYVRPTLAPAKLIVQAQNKYLQFPEVQAISTDINTYQKTFQQRLRKEYKQIFGESLSTLKLTDEDGNEDGKKDNGSPRKGRPFYVCALRNIIRNKYKGLGSAAIYTYIQKALAHENIGVTMNYLASYDESTFVNPVDINIPTNINVIGKRMDIIPTVETSEPTLESNFNFDQFVEGLTAENQFKISEFINERGMGETQAVLALVEYLSNNQKTPAKTVEKTAKNVGDNNLKGVQKVGKIVDSIMEYNRKNSGGGIEKIVTPSKNLIDRIHQKIYGTKVPPVTINKHFESREDIDELNQEFENWGVKGGMKSTDHNMDYHRYNYDELVDTILEYI